MKLRALSTVIAVGLLGVLAPRTEAQTVSQGPIVNPANGHSYYLLTSSTWTAAEAFAQSLHGHLVTIDDAAENEFVRTQFGLPNLRLWIGLSDLAGTGNYAWASGSVAPFRLWSAGEPNNLSTEHYAEMVNTGSTGTWNNITDAGLGDHGVVEVDPFTIEWSSMDGGGGELGGGTLALAGTIGQPDAAATFSGGSFTITGGFWAVVAPCRADFDGNGGVQPADIAAFVNTWFASLSTNSLDGDFDGNGAIQPADIAAFVNLWFSALSGGC